MAFVADLHRHFLADGGDSKLIAAGACDLGLEIFRMYIWLHRVFIIHSLDLKGKSKGEKI